MKSYTPETFHRLPLQYNDRSLLEQWLIVLHMDIETPIKTRQKDDRVCSTHFDKDDFTIPKRAADPKNPKRVSLKRNAIPRVQQVATDRLEVKLLAYFRVVYDCSQLVWGSHEITCASFVNNVPCLIIANNYFVTNLHMQFLSFTCQHLLYIIYEYKLYKL